MIKNELVPVFVTAEMHDEILSEMYQLCDGALFMGGGDIQPVLYHQTAQPTTEANEPARDNMEFVLLKRILKDKKPFIGICRGSQMLNVVSGGTLNQHIPDLTQEEWHGIKKEEVYDAMLNDQRHAVQIVAGTKTAHLVGKDTIMVNSGHHQSVNQLGENLMVAGRSPAGIVEIIEHTDPDYFCFGVQSHPEAMDNGDLDILFKEFAHQLNK